jgi:hypothetical protein
MLSQQYSASEEKYVAYAASIQLRVNKQVNAGPQTYVIRERLIVDVLIITSIFDISRDKISIFVLRL